MNKLKIGLKQLIAPIYHLPYYIEIKNRAKRSKKCFFSEQDLKIALESLGLRRENIKLIVYIKQNKLSGFTETVPWIKESEIITKISDKVLYDLKNEKNKFLIILDDYEFENIAKTLRKNGLKDGLHFLSAISGSALRKEYIQSGGQAFWKDVEKQRKIGKEFWLERILLMRNFIDDNCKSVLDLGCWECELSQFLPENIIYMGCDYVKRRDDTIVCDLNQYEFPNVSFDTAYISGSLEYMEHLDWYFDQICLAEKSVVLSYSALEYFPLIERRKRKSWVNHLTSAEIINFMHERGFILKDTAFWGKWTVIYKFIKVSAFP